MSWGALCYSVNWVLFWENTRLNLFELGRGTQDLGEGGSKFKKKKRQFIETRTFNDIGPKM